MIYVFRNLKWVIPLFLLIAFACSLLSLRSCASLIELNEFGEAVGDDEVANCVEAGELDPDNPFAGWPLQGGVNWGLVFATFCDPIYFQNLGSVHRGVDFAYPIGHGVLASAGGQITRAELGHAMRGNNIEICHESGYCAIYMHLTDLFVLVGDVVDAGQTIGTVGSTGNSTGPHLHFEVRTPAGTAVDPAPSLGGGPL